MIHAMVKVAAFPHLKEIMDFNFDFQPSISQQQILDFQSLRFVEENENIVFLGPSGVGKTHPQQSALRQLKSEQVPILLSAMI